MKGRWKKISFFSILSYCLFVNFVANSCLCKWDGIIRRYANQSTNTSVIKENKVLKSLDMKEPVTLPKTVNIVLLIHPGSTIPFVPSIQSSHFSIQTINYVMSNYTFSRSRKEIQDIYEHANITITNYLDDNDYIGFALGIYYKSDYVVVAIINSYESRYEITKELHSLITKSVSLLSSHSISHIVASSIQSSHTASTICTFLALHNVYLRQILMYSTISFTDPSLFTLLPLYNYKNITWLSSSFQINHSVKANLSSLYKHPSYQQCLNPSSLHSKTYSVLIRLYQRHYLEEQLDRLFQQSILPEQVFLIQNCNLTVFPYEQLVNHYQKCRIIYLWNVNWNSFFHLSYLISSLIPSSYSFTYDDDQLLKEPNMHEKILQQLTNTPGIYSLRPWCWCKEYRKTSKRMKCQEACQNHTDLVVNPFFYPSILSKFMWRYDIPMYYCCEEMSLLLSASIECDVQWFSLPYEYESRQADKRDRSTDSYTKRLKEQVDWKNIEHEAMYYYVRAGYKVPISYDPVYRNIIRDVFPIL